MTAPLLEVRDLQVWFPRRAGVFARTSSYLKAVDGVSFSLQRGETLALVGESGCGKSTTSRAILGLVRPRGGSIWLEGQPVVRRDKAFRCRVQAVFQDPLAALNPRRTLAETLSEGLVVQGLVARNAARAAAADWLKRVGLPVQALDRFPHELSGGERQRVCIARAVSLRPEILICDEAVSALDLSIRAHILELLASLKKEFGLSYLFITHDLGVVQHIADRVLVMYAGKIVESGTTDAVLHTPREDYTRRLLGAVPHLPVC